MKDYIYFFLVVNTIDQKVMNLTIIRYNLFNNKHESNDVRNNDTTETNDFT